MYAKSRPKMIGIMIGLRMKNVRTKIPRIIAPTIPFLMSTWSAMIMLRIGRL